MQERVRGTIAVVVVWVLLGALAAGAALTANINGTLGEEMAGGTRVTGEIEEMAGGTRVTGEIEEMAIYIKPQGSGEVAAGGYPVDPEHDDNA